ncbi:MAG: FeoB-associated Cys-rich membrane protein [Prevotella sp.]|nr:FeoB-associated Cys-rich membrane protein [Prevotella sp.]
MIQTLLTYTILALSIAYALYSIYKAIKSAKNPCYGCEGCPLKEKRMRQNTPCPKKK